MNDRDLWDVAIIFIKRNLLGFSGGINKVFDVGFDISSLLFRGVDTGYVRFKEPVGRADGGGSETITLIFECLCDGLVNSWGLTPVEIRKPKPSGVTLQE